MTMTELEAIRENVYWDYIKALGTDREQLLLTELDRLDAAMDLLNESQIPAEDVNTTIHWDEWMLDLKIDMAREDALAYER